jgi:squalene-associated FAD-dependent desaturase
MPDNPSPSSPVVVVGGGWAGLATAVELCRRSIPVLLLESARQLGGRARSVRFDEAVVDNGQHLMLGAYQSMLALMQRVHADHERAFLRIPLTLRLFKRNKTTLELKARRLPPPYHLFVAILTARGLSATDRAQAIRFGHRLARTRIAAAEDISVQALLHSEAQTPTLIHKLWSPLCLAALNTPIGEASARVFVRVLRDSFLQPCNHSDLLVPKLELSDVLPRPCADYLEKHGAHIELGQRVTGLDIANNRVRAVNVGQRRVDADHVVLATPHIVTRRLASPHQSLKGLCKRLHALGNEPVATLYFQFPPTVSLPQPVVGLKGATSQWVFDRRVCGHPGMMAVVISGRGTHASLTTEQLSTQVASELATSFPHWPAYEWVRVIREKRATFCSRVGIDVVRPDNSTAISGLWLAGDYTATELPATLESAVRSGTACAEAIVDSM